MELFISFLFLTFLEIILGIDNIIFIALITNKLPKHLQKQVRLLGLTLSLIFRLILLAFIGFLLRFNQPLFSLLDKNISVKDIIMIAGGLFLLAKATLAIHEDVTKIHDHNQQSNQKIVVSGVLSAIVQIILVDLVFSLDSLITAIGITNNISVIAAAIIISIVFMVLFAPFVSNFIEKYPTLKMLAISFIMMIGIFLVLEGLSIHVSKGYIYFAMGFSLVVEFLNILVKSKKITPAK